MAAQDLVERQRQNNLEQIPHFELCAGHRERLSSLVISVARPDARLCVLGAGNCFDLDLPQLLGAYREVHLVDLDPEALARGVDRVPAELQPRVVRHAPIDLSGLLDDLERWRARTVSLEEVLAHPGRAAVSLAARLPGPFDVVVSTCLLTQMQLSLLDALSDAHPLFEAARETLNLTHFRTLSELITPAGLALLVTDVTSNHTAPLADVDPESDLRPLFERLVAEQNVFHAVHPARWPMLVRDDPVLSRDAQVSRPLDVWLWQNGPALYFLVYAAALRRRTPRPSERTP